MHDAKSCGCYGLWKLRSIYAVPTVSKLNFTSRIQQITGRLNKFNSFLLFIKPPPPP